MDGDIVIRGGTSIDGTGAPARPADVAVTDGRIVARRRPRTLRGDRELDASGQVVAPGFIDIHTHYDAQVFWDPWLTPSSFHGVTTVVAGNCGFSIAPIRPEGRGPAGPHPPARRGHELRHPVGRGALGRVRDLPGVSRRRRAAGHAAQLRLLRRPHRRAALRHGRGVLRAGGHGGGAGPDAGRGGRGHGRRVRPVSPPAPRPPTTATVAGPSPPGSATWTSSGPCLAPLHDAGQGVVALLPGDVFSHKQVFDLQQRGGPTRHLDRAAHREGLPVPREGGRRERRRREPTGSRSGPRSRAGPSCSR